MPKFMNQWPEELNGIAETFMRLISTLLGNDTFMFYGVFVLVIGYMLSMQYRQWQEYHAWLDKIRERGDETAYDVIQQLHLYVAPEERVQFLAIIAAFENTWQWMVGKPFRDDRVQRRIQLMAAFVAQQSAYPITHAAWPYHKTLTALHWTADMHERLVNAVRSSEVQGYQPMHLPFERDVAVAKEVVKKIGQHKILYLTPTHAGIDLNTIVSFVCNNWQHTHIYKLQAGSMRLLTHSLRHLSHQLSLSVEVLKSRLMRSESLVVFEGCTDPTLLAKAGLNFSATGPLVVCAFLAPVAESNADVKVVTVPVLKESDITTFNSAYQHAFVDYPYVTQPSFHGDELECLQVNCVDNDESLLRAQFAERRCFAYEQALLDEKPPENKLMPLIELMPAGYPVVYKFMLVASMSALPMPNLLVEVVVDVCRGQYQHACDENPKIRYRNFDPYQFKQVLADMQKLALIQPYDGREIQLKRHFKNDQAQQALLAAAQDSDEPVSVSGFFRQVLRKLSVRCHACRGHDLVVLVDYMRSIYTTMAQGKTFANESGMLEVAAATKVLLNQLTAKLLLEQRAAEATVHPLSEVVCT